MNHQAFETLRLSPNLTDADVQSQKQDLLSYYEEILTELNWQQLGHFFEFDMRFALLSEETLDAFIEHSPQLAKMTGQDTQWRLACELFISIGRNQRERVAQLVQQMDDPSYDPCVWITYLEKQSFVQTRHHFLETPLWDLTTMDPPFQTYGYSLYLAQYARFGVTESPPQSPEQIERDAHNLPPHYRLWCYSNLTAHYQSTGQMHHAWRLEHEVLREAEWLGCSDCLLEALSETISTQLTLGQIREALRHIERANQLQIRPRDWFGHNRLKAETARTYLFTEQFDSAIDLSRQAKEAFEQHGPSYHALAAHILWAFASTLHPKSPNPHALQELLDAPNYINETRSLMVVRFAVAVQAWLNHDISHTRDELQTLRRDAQACGDPVWAQVAALAFDALLDEEVDTQPQTTLPFGLPPVVQAWCDALNALGNQTTDSVDLSMLSRSLTGLFLKKMIEHHPPSPTMTLWLATKTFTVAQHTRDLKRRSSLWSILTKLCEQCPNAVDVNALFEVGWPNQEHVDPWFAARRVYWAIGELRRLGLEERIITHSPGYAMVAPVQIK